MAEYRHEDGRDSRRLFTRGMSLDPVSAGDVDELHALWTHEDVRRFLWDGEVIPIDRTREIVGRSQALFEESGYGIWSVREGRPENLVGFAGYWHFRTPPSLELLFGVAATHWNRGVATAAAQAVIRYGFEALGFHSIEASTDVGNTASIRVLEKLGMQRRERDVVDGLDTVFYRLVRGSEG